MKAVSPATEIPGARSSMLFVSTFGFQASSGILESICPKLPSVNSCFLGGGLRSLRQNVVRLCPYTLVHISSYAQDTDDFSAASRCMTPNHLLTLPEPRNPRPSPTRPMPVPLCFSLVMICSTVPNVRVPQLRHAPRI